MNYILSILLIAAHIIVYGNAQSEFISEEENYFLSNEFINLINSKTTSWEAGQNFHPNTSMEYFESLMGVHPDSEKYSLPVKLDPFARFMTLPRRFNAIERWPHCPSINEIRDQGPCGSCWAFGAAEAMTDRLCIHSGGSQKFHFSAKNILACCHNCGYGCKGGFPGRAWQYWVSQGVVSGGPYGSHQGCQPYSLIGCEHHVHGRKPRCSKFQDHTPRCEHRCDRNYHTPYSRDLHFGKKAYKIAPNAQAIQYEIMTNGPVEAVFTFYYDLFSYKRGVYQHVGGRRTGQHAVRILGWGEEQNRPYWLIANSYNKDWGNGGYFKMLRGYNHCGIESQVFAGIPRL